VISADAGKTGAISLYGHDTLTLKAAVAASQIITFQGGQNDLQLALPVSFAGTLSGLSATDMIDFLKQDIVSATATGTTISVSPATGGTIDLALAAPLDGLSLTLHADNAGGTDLLFSTPPSG
jgi:hypothetical protein